MSPHLCILTTAHPYDDVRVYSKVARSFADRGWRVTWVGVDRHYFTAAPLADPRITHHLVPGPRRRIDRLARRRSLRSAASEVKGVDWFYTPDPDGVSLALSLGRQKGAGVLFDIHEAFHGALLTRWTFGREVPLLPALVKRQMRRLADRCDAVSAVSRSLLDTYTAAERSETAVLLRNAAPLSFAAGASPDRRRESRSVVRFMHGKALPNNGTPVLLEAARHLLDRGHVGFRLVVFDSMSGEYGAYDPALRARIAELGLADVVECRPSVPHAEMGSLLDDCDVGLISYGRILGADSLPNRFFEYLGRGMPVIVPEYSPEMAQVVRAHRLGGTADFEDANGIADAMERFLVNPSSIEEQGRRSLDVFNEDSHWEHDFNGLLRALRAR